MGIVAVTYEKSSFALGIQSFMDQYRDPPFLSFKDQPYLPEPYTSLLEKSNAMAQAMRDTAESTYEEGFAARTQSGFPAWAGPPGMPENRPIRTPEDPKGSVFSRVG
ncbi:hypothetical protein DPQ33_15580 [Oceanidesulfovibrio indonesiensis]|uniref:Uncharacterized protein n=1 Tax=Oceanidesulfovibrio indonesiensis TaxID=54767 RepID=A0A7M3MBZ3_9BACT|nr:hypothetical protein [Oceanidesulfovibrio indonesiensis]TVM15382.1 hypothetical protein DPQ33_15580 [Oceanidesulfovibrio indonesiensis]